MKLDRKFFKGASPALETWNLGMPLAVPMKSQENKEKSELKNANFVANARNEFSPICFWVQISNFYPVSAGKILFFDLRRNLKPTSD
jgi:hypothetical protein